MVIKNMILVNIFTVILSLKDQSVFIYKLFIICSYHRADYTFLHGFAVKMIQLRNAESQLLAALN